MYEKIGDRGLNFAHNYAVKSSANSHIQYFRRIINICLAYLNY